ncbi:hypothetical protein [Flammeovirga aprica]|uniref:Uncharacterized protein n=1 Tax=Flammeovirga aprica JL-4 TaxID=694437 RepID=A0A7X9P3R3_9BACT|nr:hypothetical protein [Flammeovirga aprica]NME67992.1 hypothetical protein [Flammeovirga aprica JL-4]
MRIIFGTRHFKLKSYTLKELELSDSEFHNITIERRQKYFHLYWIPFCPVEKMWALRKNGELYDLPAEYAAILEAKGLQHKTPFYTFALPLLVIAGFAFYGAKEKIRQYQSSQRVEQSFTEGLASLNEKVASPMPLDYYRLDAIGDYKSNTYLKVLAVQNDSIFAQLPYFEPRWSSSQTSGKLDTYFPQDPVPSQLKWFAIADFKNCIQTEYKDNDFEGGSLLIDDKAKNYRLVNIYHFEGPDFKDKGEGSMANDQIAITLINEGLTTTITDIKPIKGNVEWTSELPLTASADRKFTLKGSYKAVPTYKVQITCKNADNSTYRYELTGSGVSRELQQL